jgi:hypothetical protein
LELGVPLKAHGRQLGAVFDDSFVLFEVIREAMNFLKTSHECLQTKNAASSA